MKFKLFSVLVMLVACYYKGRAIDIVSPLTTSLNHNTSNVTAMAMDAAGNTYVLQNLYTKNGGVTDASLSGYSGSSYIPFTGGHGCMVIDRIPAGGGPANTYAVIDIAPSGGHYASSIDGAGIAVDGNGRVYVAGSFKGIIRYRTGTVFGTAVYTTVGSNNSSRDAFVCRIDGSTNNIDIFNPQGGTGQEYATAITTYNAGNTLFVAGYYHDLSSSTEVTSFNTGTTITAPGAANLLQNNGFTLKYDISSGLTCNWADGWANLLTTDASITPHGVTGNGVRVYYTGEFTGNVAFDLTTLSHTTYSTCPLMFTAGIDYGLSAYIWAKAEGNEVSFSSKSSGNAMYIEGTNLMVTGSFAQTTVSATHAGAADAVLIRYNGIVTMPTVQWIYNMGSKGNDQANAIVNDGGGYIISGNMSNTGAYYYYNACSTYTYTNLSAKEQAFVASFSSTGTLNWVRYGDGDLATSTAVASNQKCHVAFGGMYNSRLKWNEGTVMGSTSPVTNRLYAALLPTKVVNVNPEADPYPLNNGSSQLFTTSSSVSISSYSWTTIVSPPLVVTYTTPSSSSTNVTMVSGGSPGTSFMLNLQATYTHNGTACTTLVTKKIIQTPPKREGAEEEIDETISIGRTDESLLTLNTYPNPVANNLTIGYSLTEAKPAVINVTDMTGRIVFEKEVNAQNAEELVFTDLWSGGTYVVSLMQDGKLLKTKNVVKQ